MTTIYESLSEALVSLYSTNKFYANVMMLMDREESKKTEIAAVTVKNARIKLLINTENFNKMTKDQRVFVIKHECCHVIFKHLLIKPKDSSDQKIWNVAMDLVINSQEGMEDVANEIGGVTHKTLQEKFNISLQRNQTSEIYYYALQKESEKNKKFKEYLEDAEAHDFGEELPEQVMKDIIKKLVQKALAGTNSAEGLDLLNSLGKGKVDWRRELRNSISNSFSVLFEDTRSKRNRRYGILYPGKKQKPEVTVAFITDTSGSMSNESLAAGWAEMIKIKQEMPEMKIMMIQADSEVKEAVEFDVNMPPVIKGRGGTAYQPAITKALELECNLIVYFGDMDSADSPEDPSTPFIWLVTGKQSPPGDFGSTIYLDEVQEAA